MSDTEKAIEYFAGELPPGWEFSDEFEPSVFHSATGASTLCCETSEAAAREAWSIYGGRRAYAESQCIARVREMWAKVHPEGHVCTQHRPSGEAAVTTYTGHEVDGDAVYSALSGDLLSAAYTVCLAIERGQP